MKVSGIYKIVNKINKKYYVGGSANIKSRWRGHRRALNLKRHHNDYLQHAWNKYGEDEFEFIVIELTKPNHDKLLNVEQKFLDIAKKEKNKSYNLSFIAGRVDMTEEVRKKIGLSAMGHKRNVGRKYSQETVDKRRAHKWKWSKESKQRLSEKCMGRIMSKETRRKIGLACRGKVPHNIDTSVRTFHNVRTGKIYEGTKSDFIKKYKLFKQPVYLMINGNGRLKSYRGWIHV